MTYYNFVQNACLSELKMINKGENKFIIKPWKSYYDCNKLVAFNRKRYEFIEYMCVNVGYACGIKRQQIVCLLIEF